MDFDSSIPGSTPGRAFLPGYALKLPKLLEIRRGFHTPDFVRMRSAFPKSAECCHKCGTRSRSVSMSTSQIRLLVELMPGYALTAPNISKVRKYLSVARVHNGVVVQLPLPVGCWIIQYLIECGESSCEVE